MEKTTINRNIERISNQMLKGFKNDNNILKIRDKFIQKYGPVIELMLTALPKQPTIAAVLCKAAIKNGALSIQPFCHRYNKQAFDGVLDPAFQLWEHTKRGKSTGLNLYKLTVSAIRMDQRGKPYKKLRLAESDLFEFDENLEIVSKKVVNDNPKKAK